MLTEFAERIWVANHPHRFYGLQVGARMTIVRLGNGGLFMHSPIPLNPDLKRAIDDLGPVRHIVCPNLYHHVHAAGAQAAYPKALLHGPAKLRKKRRDLDFSDDLSEEPHADWAEELLPIAIAGTMLEEIVFVHPATRTVISADLTENFRTSDHWPTRLYLKAAGIHGRIGWSRLLRFIYRDRAAVRASIDRLLENDFDGLIIAHGDVIQRNGKDAIRQTFDWL